jgi:predicted DNA-binding transcriptional regulator YafY
VTPACRRQPTSTNRYAIRAARKMRITYQDADGRGTERVIQPIAVAHYVGATLICAWCELRNDVRHFRADRVVTADVLDESFCTDVTAVGTRFFSRVSSEMASTSRVWPSILLAVAGSVTSILLGRMDAI